MEVDGPTEALGEGSLTASGQTFVTDEAVLEDGFTCSDLAVDDLVATKVHREDD